MLATLSSQVHNKETSTLSTDFDSYGSYRRSQHQAEFSAAYSVYDHMDDPDHRSKADLLSDCRQNAWFTRHKETGEIRVASNACHLRWCPVCAQSKRNFIGHAVAEWLEVQDHPKLMTLTIKHSDATLLTQVNNLYRHFMQLRKLKDFRDLVSGGIWFFQIKISKSDGKWHPHIHCVVTGKYIPRRLLRNLWLAVTGDSIITDVRSVKDPAGCALEVARYAATPGPIRDLTLDHALELVDTMHGKRICGTWGTGRKVSLCPPKFTDKDSWKSIGSWCTVMANRKTNKVCEQIFHAWKNHEPLEDKINLYPHECRKDGQHVFIAEDSNVLDEIYSEDWRPP